MKVTILDQGVRHNVLLFKKLIQRLEQQHKDQFETIQKTYEAYLHKKTGEIRFIDLEKDKSFLKDKNWKLIQIQLHFPAGEKEDVFEVVEPKTQEKFQYSDLQPVAYRTMIETIRTLNSLSFTPFAPQTSKRVLKQIVQLEIEPAGIEEGKKDLIHEAWHQVDRLEAEKLLEDLAIGTFLFRKDEFAWMLEERLKANIDSSIKCLILTFSEWDHKVSERIIIYRNGQWQIYDDDPTLSGPSYVSIEELLSKMGNLLNKPLLND